MDLARLSNVFRAVRLRHGWRQADVARLARSSRSQVARCESREIVDLKLETILQIAVALGIQLDLTARWRGSALDRLLNSAHSALHDRVARLLSSVSGWQFLPEVTFSIYGERGVIDILAFHARSGALLVIELKTQVIDVQQLIGQVDRYVRLALRVAHERGWQPRHVSAWVIVAESRTSRRRIAAHASVISAAFPASGRDIRSWLKEPAGPIRALSFLSYARPTRIGQDPATRKRADTPRASVIRAQPSAQPRAQPLRAPPPAV